MLRQPEPTDDGVVLVVDDDHDVRQALAGLFRSVGLASASFASGEEMLMHVMPDRPTCIVLDVRLRGASGLDLQSHLNDAGRSASIVFISGYGDVPMTVAAMKAGAVSFIPKPFREQDLLDAVNEALERDRDRRQARSQTQLLRERFDALTGREQEVMQRLVHGLMNKEVADQLGISQATVKIYRGQAMRKMQARTFAELILMAQALGLVMNAAAQVPI
ncbi:response regulator transcription factor [Cupriavidus pauculus]|uniref:response regulator transcription factor n=1 Tax=Cupriavidus pauculus TaxID=82633 RepID=UPI001EE1A8B1|nr:response regulator [Cupriavidus pauculus]GJG94881.1 response regulator transcription factor [Cupriavidus pauculus]